MTKTSNPARSSKIAESDNTLPFPLPAPRQISHSRIGQRAFDFWLRRGCVHGFDVNDWLEAEKELIEESALMKDCSE